MNGLSAGVEFGPPQRGRDATSREARGRRCEAPGCSTVLSTYNRSRTCYLHTKPTEAAEARRPVEALEALRGRLGTALRRVFTHVRAGMGPSEIRAEHR